MVLRDFDVKHKFTVMAKHTFPVWSACDTEEHLIPFKKQGEGQVKKRKEQGGPLFFKNPASSGSPTLFSGTGTPEAAASSPRWGSGCSTALETGPRGVVGSHSLDWWCQAV